ncbi:MAG: hypothetical protein IJG30_01905 [Synergistaceae bacterium]|nr:hypothetical protein [Synergistaceae bacterium]
MVYNFVGEALTLADLEKAAATTKSPLSDGARESWEYFGFGREHEWKAVMLGSQAILITDESQDLNMTDVCPDIDTFLLWLEGSHEERQKAAEKERRFLGQQGEQEQQGQQEQIGIKAEQSVE